MALNTGDPFSLQIGLMLSVSEWLLQDIGQII